MPGINLLCDFEQRALITKSLYLETLNEITCDVDYSSEIFQENDNLILSYTKYQRYPVNSFENDRFKIILEGRIYNKQGSELEEHLFAIADLALKEGGYCKQEIAEWLLGSDGEFNVFIIDKTSGNIRIINDVLGRLPIYYFISDNQFILSRHQGFVTAVSQQRQCDRLGLAELLLFNHCMGKRTLVEGVCCLSPASVVSIDFKNRKTDIETVYEFDFEQMKQDGASSAGDIEKLISLFSEGLKDRAKISDGQTNVLSLSGGLDSRLVAGLFDYCKIPFSAMTYIDPQERLAKEAQVSGMVAQLVKTERKTVEISKLKGVGILRMLKLKSGICPISKGFIFDYYSSIKQMLGDGTVLFGGNGGNNLLEDTRPVKTINCIEDFADHKQRKEGLFSYEEVALLTGVSRDEIIHEIRDLTDSYPERTWQQKWVHLYFYCRTFRRWNDGEDRNRSFSWATSPFWSVNFFRYIMSWPDRDKQHHRIHQRLLSSICPALDNVVNANTDDLLSAESSLTKRSLKWLWKLPNPIRFIYKRSRKSLLSSGKSIFMHDESLLRCMKSQLDNSDAVKSYLSDSVIHDIIANGNKYSRAKMAALFTAMSMSEYVVTGSSSLEQYLEDDFALLGEF